MVTARTPLRSLNVAAIKLGIKGGNSNHSFLKFSQKSAHSNYCLLGYLLTSPVSAWMKWECPLQASVFESLVSTGGTAWEGYGISKRWSLAEGSISLWGGALRVHTLIPLLGHALCLCTPRVLLGWESVLVTQFLTWRLYGSSSARWLLVYLFTINWEC